ncbi:MAG TPA: DUF1016 N-terminal domain-containing protein, partial [bacterium]|nr:DUF1016 N-terminal domain-containing protein [bacterium]
MPETALVSTGETYDKLVIDLKDLIAKGQQAALNAVNEIRVTTYWQMGKRMAELQELADADEASTLIARLAESLGLDQTLLYRVFQFYRTWPDGIPKVEESVTLSWAHYVELISIKDEKERQFYLQHAAMEEWSRDTLRKAIQKDFFTLEKSKKTLPAGEVTLERGGDPLHIYKA